LAGVPGQDTLSQPPPWVLVTIVHVLDGYCNI
jgi:hypothetical protein